MTEQEIQEYISENEPTTINKDEIGRWSERIWQLENSQIVETYTYKYTVSQVQNNVPRDAFKVSKVERKEIANG
jgi:hypothetical protein